MKFLKDGSDYLVRIDRGEEVVASLLDLMDQEGIQAGSFTGLGASDQVILGIYYVGEQAYKKETYTGEFEIASLFGTLSRKDGAPYVHAHAVIGDVAKDQVYGGHLQSAVISGTCEIHLRALDLTVGRKLDDVTGLQILDFGD